MVEHNFGDRDIFLRYAIVGPAWAEPCRPLLFYDVRLGPRHFCEDSHRTLNIFSVIPRLSKGELFCLLLPFASSVLQVSPVVDPPQSSSSHCSARCETCAPSSSSDAP